MGMSDDWFERELAPVPVMAILRGLGVDASLALAERLWDAGLRTLELPIQRPDDLVALEAVAAAGRERGLAVGAGTVVRVDQVDAAVRAGAAFTVSPGLDPEVVAASLAAGLPTLPGVGTGTEVQHAVRLGLGWLKAFPAAQLGAGWCAAMHGPFPDVRFVATGGVTVATAREFLAGGARVVALGSALADPSELDVLRTLLAQH